MGRVVGGSDGLEWTSRRTGGHLLWLLAVLITLFSIATTPAKAGSDPESASDPYAARVDALFSEYNRSSSPGLALAVVKDGAVVLRRGYGLADLEHGAPITPSTVFDTASIAKQVTGLSVAMLVEQGKIKLSDDVRKYIPELPDYGRVVTIDHLLHHTSGVRDWPGAIYVSGWTFGDVITHNHILTLAYSQKGLNFTPGEEHLYSNTGYNILAEVVRRVTGKTFSSWTAQHIFQPLGMANSHFRDDHTEVIANRAFGYSKRADGTFGVLPDNLTAPGSSSLFSTVDDMARWLVNFDTASVGGRSALSLMQTPGRLNDGTSTPYAFGIVGGVYRGQPMFGHSGGWAGFDTYTVYMPKQRLGVVVFANCDAINAQDAVIKIANIYLDNELPAVAAGAPQATRALEPVTVAQTDLARIAGLYRLRPGRYARIKTAAAGLTFQTLRALPAARPKAPQSREIPLLALSPLEFRDSSGAIHLVFHGGKAGAKAPAFDYDGKLGVRVDESSVRPPVLSDYLGVYTSSDLETSYTITVRNGVLEARHRRHGVIPLTHLWRDDFGAGLDYLTSFEFQRDRAGKVTGLLINGDSRNRDFRFERRAHS